MPENVWKVGQMYTGNFCVGTNRLPVENRAQTPEAYKGRCHRWEHDEDV